MDQGFTDVSMSNAHYDAINCLAYYGITSGKTADTYDPGSHITRSQMALFLTSAAAKAGIDLGDAMDMGFTDLDSTGANRVAAINTLASKGIMPGRTATTFDPTGLVTRADMAQHLFTLLDLALDSIHIDSLPSSSDGDGTGIELNVVNGDGVGPDDYFGDVRRTLPAHIDDIISAVYELGVTAGTNNMTGEMGTFEPTRPVTRAQMATFIMAALGHTNLRPAGLTAQQTATKTQVSVRDTDFKPVATLVELISTDYPDDAFDRNGRCITTPAYVTGLASGFGACSIDSGDRATDAMGNALFDVGSASGSRSEITCATTNNQFRFTGAAGAPATVWAWHGDVGDTLDSRSTDLAEPSAANATNPGRATSAVFSGGTANAAVRMGDTLTYTIQLVNSLGQPVGPTPGANNDYTVTIVKNEDSRTDLTTGTPTYDSLAFRQTTTRSPDSSGRIAITVTNPDPTPYAAVAADANNADVQVAVTISRASANTLPVTDMTGGTAIPAGATGSAVTGVTAQNVVFSDNAPVPNGLVATSAPWRLHSSVPGANRNSISVAVSDQYGNPFGGTGANYVIQPTDSTNFDFLQGQVSGGTQLTYRLPASGRTTITYSHVGTSATTQTVDVELRTREVANDGTVTIGSVAVTALDGSTDIDQDVVVRWADRGFGTGSNSGSETVLVGDPGTNNVVVEDFASGTADPPKAFQYGPDDTFLVEGTPVTLEQFEEVLGSYGTRASDPVSNLGSLSWSRYDFNRPRDGAEWRLTGLSCRASAATR